MRIAVAAAILAAFGAGSAVAACPPGATRNCVNLDAVPQISQQIIAKEPVSGVKITPASGSSTAYTGPTFGLAPGVRRAPTVGYRWAID